MCRLVGYMSNDPHLLKCCLFELRDVLKPGPSDKPGGYGIGYYRDGDTLMHKRPTAGSVEVDYYEALKEVSTACFIAQYRKTSDLAPKIENTPPFRFKRWLFASSGAIGNQPDRRKAFLSEIPEFLSRGIAGEADSEILFNLFLTLVHAEGKLDDPAMEPQTIENMLRATNWSIMTVAKKAGFEPPLSMNAVVTNGLMLGGLHTRGSMSYLVKEGIAECKLCGLAKSRESSRTSTDVAHKKFKAVVILGDVGKSGEGWGRVPEGSIVTVSRQLKVEVSPLY